jgi:hypothetical protein
MTRSFPLLATLSLASCAPYLSLATPAPPSATLVLDGKNDRIEVSQGVAGAFVPHCVFVFDCDRTALKARVDSPAVVDVRRAHLGSLDSWDDITANTPVFAVVGVAPGHATLQLSDGSHTRDYSVTVLPR